MEREGDMWTCTYCLQQILTIKRQKWEEESGQTISNGDENLNIENEKPMPMIVDNNLFFLEKEIENYIVAVDVAAKDLILAKIIDTIGTHAIKQYQLSMTEY